SPAQLGGAAPSPIVASGSNGGPASSTNAHADRTDASGHAGMIRRATTASRQPPRLAGPFARLAATWSGYEERREQLELANAIEATMDGGGVLVADAGTGIRKSLAYLVPALGPAQMP